MIHLRIGERPIKQEREETIKLPAIKGKRLKVVRSKQYDISTAVAQTILANSAMPPVFTAEMIEVFYENFLKPGKKKPYVVPELDESWLSDEIIDDDVAKIWEPILREPLLQFVCGTKDSAELMSGKEK